jgi:chromosome segregation ATPase
MTKGPIFEVFDSQMAYNVAFINQVNQKVDTCAKHIAKVKSHMNVSTIRSNENFKTVKKCIQNLQPYIRNCRMQDTQQTLKREAVLRKVVEGLEEELTASKAVTAGLKEELAVLREEFVLLREELDGLKDIKSTMRSCNGQVRSVRTDLDSMKDELRSLKRTREEEVTLPSLHEIVSGTVCFSSPSKRFRLSE